MPTASAQTAGTGGSSTTNTGGISWVLSKVGDEQYPDTTNYTTPINKRQCDANAELHLSLTGIPMGFKYLEVWVGDTCQNGDRETRVGMALCEFVKIKEQDPAIISDNDFTIPVDKACTLGDGARSFYVLPVNTMRGTETAAKFARITLNFDRTPPSAPTGVHGGAGETVIGVSWSQPTSDNYYFWLVVDRNVSAGDTDSGDADCSSANLTAGAEFDPESSSLPEGLWVKHINQKVSSTELDGQKDLHITRGRAAVAVIAEDLGRNRSVLSNVDCIEVVPTTGFWDAYRAGGGQAEPGCACTTPGAGLPNTRMAWPVLVALSLLTAAWRRARRRA
jgi:hypothetical protein